MKHITAVLIVAALAGFAMTMLAQESASQPLPLYVRVVSVDTTRGKVVVTKSDGQQLTVPTDANTKVKVNGKDASLNDVKPGVVIRVSPTTGTAVDIQAFPPQTAPATQVATSRPVYSTIASVDMTSGKVVVKKSDGQEATVATDANTKITVEGKAATLGDVKPGMRIVVRPPTGTAASIVADTPVQYVPYTPSR